MSSSRRGRRRLQEQSFPRHQLWVEGLEKRYALDSSSFVGPEGWGWIGVSPNTQVKAVAEDSTGAVFIAGTFSGTVDVDFSEATHELASNGLEDAFVAKYTKDGEFVWGQSFGSSGKDRGYALAVAGDDSIRIGGFFSETVDFNSGASAAPLTSNGAGDGFVLALDNGGNYLWAGQFGGTGTHSFNSAGDFTDSLAVDSLGNTVVGGVMHYSATATFGAQTVTVTGSGPQNSIILKIDNQGELIWTKHFDSSFLNGVYDIAAAPSGDVIVGGFLHSATMDADPGPGYVGLANAGVADAYIVALDSAGNYRWGYSYGSSVEESTGGVATDAAGNVFMVAGLGGTQDLDPGIQESPFTADGNQDVVVISFGADGSFRWAETFGGTGSAGGHKLIVEESGGLVLGGVYENSLSMPDGTGISNLVSAGSLDNYVLWLDSVTGSPQRAMSIGTTANENQAVAIASAGSDGLLVGGQLFGSGNFNVSPNGPDFLVGNGSAVAVPAGGGGYLIRLSPSGYRPTLDALSDVNINEDDPEQTISLTGITAGGGETQVLSITATSDNTGLIPDPTVDFDGQSSTGILKLTPVADQSGTATITVTVTDGGLDNDLSTPEDNGSILRTVVVKADPVNDAPVLDPAASLQLASVLEDAAAPVGQVGSLVSNLIDAGGIHNNFSDVDGDSPGIAITGVNLQGGSLWFSNDDGATWVDVGAVSNAVPKLLAADATTRLYFQPAANFNGTIGDVITLRAWDRTGHWDESSTSLLGESAGDGFGHSVALSGDGLTAIVGGLSNDGSGSNAGHVQVYRRADETAAWFQLGPDFEGENPEDAEGFSVAISANGNTVAFGTPRSDDAFLNAGQVRIFRWDGIQWSQLGTDINGMGTDECSGWAIDLNEHGDIIAIGGVSDPAGTVRGQTRVYKYVDSEWTQVGSDIPGEAVGDWSGHSVRLSGDGEIVAIGASHNGPDTGHVRVFSWNGSVWLQQGSDIDGEHAGDQFGHSVAMSQDGRFVAIGSPHNSDGGSLAGHVRVLQWNAVDNAWQQVGADLDGESAGDRYGAAVAISDDGKLLAIGAHGAHNFTGHVSVYQWTGSEWNNLPHGSVHGLSDREFFGLSVDLSSNGHTMIVGAPSTPLAVASTSSNSGYSKIISLAPALNALSDSADTVSVTVVPENDEPTLDVLSDTNINEDDPEQTVNLTGITAGGGETQVLSVTATSDNTGLIPDPTVTFDGQSSTGTLKFTPVADQFGTATITVTVEDGGLDDDLGTPDDNGSILRTVVVKAEAVNDEPTLDELSDVNINEDDPEQTISLTGISAGGGETQVLSITATSDNTGLIPDPTVDFDGQSSTATLNFTPVADQSGTATITVTVEDGGLDNDLSTPEDNGSILRTVVVKADPVNDTPLLDPAVSPQLAAVLEDAGAPVGQVGTLVSALIDSGGTHNNFGDVDGDLPGIAITGTNLQGGSLYYSTDDGATWTDVGAVAETSTRVLYADGVTRLAYQPRPNFSGTIDNLFSFKAWDRQGNFSNGDANVNTQDLSATHVMSQFETNNTSAGLAMSSDGKYAYVAVNEDGLEIIDVQNPAEPMTIGLHDTYNYASGVAISPDGKYAYVADYFYGVEIVNIEDPAAPFFVGRRNLGGISKDVQVSPDGRYAYVAARDSLEIVAVQFPASPTVISSFAGNEINGVDLSPDGRYAFITSFGTGKGFEVIDIQNPALPVSVASRLSAGKGRGLTLSPDGRYAYVAQSEYGVKIFDVQDPSNPWQVGLMPAENLFWANDVVLSPDGRYAYVAAHHQTHIFNVSDPSVPYRVGAFNFLTKDGQGAATKLAITPAGGHVFVGLGDPGIQIINVTSSMPEFSSQTEIVSLAVTPQNDEPILDALSDININEDAPEQTVSLTGITAGPLEQQELRVIATSSNTSLIPNPTVIYSSPDSTGSLTFTPVTDANGTATITVTVEDGGLDNDLSTPDDNGSILRTVVVKADPVNDEPTLDALSDININEDDPEQTVSLTGITAGGGEVQVLSITATSDNTGLIPDPTVDFDGQSLTGTLKFTPVADQFGTATITVTVEDGGLDNDLGTPDDNGSILRTVVVKAEAVNDEPTLDPVSDLVLPEDSSTQVLDITGITAGGGENQPLQVTASSSDPSLVLHPTVTSRPALGSDTSLLTVTPLPDQYGIATITVTVEDGGLDLDLDTAEDNATFSQTFDVTITPDTDSPPSPVTPHGKMFIHETLSGDSLVSYQLPAVNVNGEAINGLFNRITAASSDTALIPDPTVLYASADVPSSLSFTPVANANGTATLSIQVEDGGPDNDFATTEDNRQATHQVEVNVLEVISNQNSAILAKDSSENLYVNTQPVVYHNQQQAQSTIAGFAAIGATSEDGENALLVQRSSVTNRLVTDDAWRINGLFDSLQNESSTVLDLTAREVSSTLNVAAVSGAYEINGVNNPSLIVRRGQTYTLNLNVAGHPFYLQTTGSGYQSANAYSGGFTGNGQTSGEHQWVVPEDAPDEIYYQCEFHPVMFGKIIVID